MAKRKTADVETVIVPDGYRAVLVQRRPGPPTTLPAGTRVRTMRLTDSEYSSVVDFVKKIRAKTA